MLDKRGPVPIYHQLKELIRQKIEDGEWASGALIPSERELCEQYDISRMTVRHALSELVHEGLLYREQGKGTFVAEPRITQELGQLTGFTQDMQTRSKTPGAKVLCVERQPAAPPTAQALQIQPGRPLIVVERLRLADREPMAIEASHLSFRGCEELLQQDLSQSLYQLLREEYQLIPTRAEQQIEADDCTSREAELLAVPPGSPVLRNRRTTYDQRDRPFEYTKSVYRGDRYIFHVELTA